MMEPKERWCFNNLQNACVGSDFLSETYGITWPIDEQFEQDFATWRTGRRVQGCLGNGINRHHFEQFLQVQRLETRKYAAAKLGMTPESLDELLTTLSRIGLSKKYTVYPGIIDESLRDDLPRSLVEFRFRTFGTHDSYCKVLHEVLQASLGVAIVPLMCATAEELGESPLYAATWDNITLRPLSIKHSVWLDFRKPISLGPDRCSKLVFAKYFGELRPHMAGREEPRDLQRYLQFVGAA